MLIRSSLFPWKKGSLNRFLIKRLNYNRKSLNLMIKNREMTFTTIMMTITDQKKKIKMNYQ